ncbi:MAG: ComF family protein [Gammaproteobacteria bacterium]
MNDWLNIAQSLLFPPICVVCGAKGSHGLDLCLGCRAELPYQKQACQRCALPLHGIHNDDGCSVALCGNCLNDSPAYDRVLSVFTYASPVDYLIQDLKFNRKLHIARLLGEIMADHLEQNVQIRPDLIIPVPLHRARLHERGYNQALELARPIARKLNLPIDYLGCERSRATPAQSDLPAKERPCNVKGVFNITGSFKGRHVAIIDDVMTTGSTVEELATALREAEASAIDVWVCARASLND